MPLPEMESSSVMRRAVSPVLTTSTVKMAVVPNGKSGVEHVLVTVKAGRMTVTCPHYDWPEDARATVRMGRAKVARDFAIAAPAGASQVTARVIGVVENQAPTRALTADLAVTGGLVEAQGDVAQIALVERHQATGQVVNAFVSGFGYRGRMAMASTVAHDSHHMIVVGTDRDQMALAANRLAEVGGGVTLWRDGQELALVELPIAGLMSNRPAREVADKAQALVAAMAECGCTLNNAFMQHSLLALVVIPELRISDKGLIDVTRFAVTDLFVTTG